MYTHRKTLLPTRPTSFIELVKRNQDTPVHRVNTYDAQGRACWFLLKADERNIVRLEHTAHEDMIDLTQFGELIDSGWGHEGEIE